jgi:hypothetical protein
MMFSPLNFHEREREPMKASRESQIHKIRTRNGSSQVTMIIVLVAIVLIAAAAYFFFMRPADSPEMAPVPPPPPTSKQARPDSARDVISALKESSPVDYASAYEQAGEFLDDGELADAQLLYFFAARGGHGPAALELAGTYDPVLFDPASSLMDEPDMFQAYKWYSNAIKAGVPEATERLAALRAWSEQAAADGNEAAQQLLLQWEQ